MFKFIKNKKYLFIIFILIIVPISVVVADELKLQTAWPLSPMTQINLQDIDPYQYGNQIANITYLIAYLYEWGIALGGLAAFVALLIAGFVYMTSVGDPTKMKEAMDRIKSALLGLIFLLSSYLILNTINPELTTLRPIDFIIDPDYIHLEIVLEPAAKLKPCDFAIVCEGENFEGRCEKMKPSQDDDFNFSGKIGHRGSVAFCRKRRTCDPTATDPATDLPKVCPAGWEKYDGIYKEPTIFEDDVGLDICKTPPKREGVSIINPDIYMETTGCRMTIYDGWGPFDCLWEMASIMTRTENLSQVENVISDEIACLELDQLVHQKVK